MKRLRHQRSSSSGFTLIELLATTAIMGVLISVALPLAVNYSIKARATEGVLLLGELRRRVEISFNRNDALSVEIPGSPHRTVKYLVVHTTIIQRFSG